MGSKRTGRHLSHEVSPFSFREFLEFTGEKPGEAALENYLRRGGFAAALRVEPQHGAVLLRELRRDVAHRDSVTRQSLRSARPLSVAQTDRRVEYLQDAWLLLGVPRFSASFKQRVTSEESGDRNRQKGQ